MTSEHAARPTNLVEIPLLRSGLTLRQFSLRDAPSIFMLIHNNRKHLSQYEQPTSDNYPTLDKVIESITNPPNQDRLRLGIWTDNHRLAGGINLTPEKSDPAIAEVGYYLGKEFTGKGIMITSVNALCAWAFENRGITEIFGVTHPDNVPSAKVLQKAGFRHTGVIEDGNVFTLYKPTHT